MQKASDKMRLKKSIAKDFGTVYDAENLEQANNAQKDIVDQHSEIALQSVSGSRITSPKP